MTPQNWPWWPPPSPPNGTRECEIEGRVTRLEVHQERQEDINAGVTDRMKWLERGLQAVATILLIVVTKQAPSSAGAIADVLLAIIKR